MKIIRSTKCSFKFANKAKQDKLDLALKEYGNVVNYFINYFWEKELPPKSKLLKDIVNLPNSWLTARLKKVAAREAIDMIKASKERWGEKAKLPFHKGRRINCSSTIADLQEKKTSKDFDAWLHLQSIGKDIILNIPIKYHKHINGLRNQGKRLESYIITSNSVQLCYEIETGVKTIEGKQIGVDSGINALATTNEGNQYGKDIKTNIERIKRCKQGSKGQKTARRALRQRIDEVAKELIAVEKPQMVVVERLKSLNKNTKLKRRLSKNIRRSLGIWTYRYWLDRLQRECEHRRSMFRSVNPAYTSQSCSKCSHTERKNRVGELFKCLSCGYTINADHNAAMNILTRFLIGAYGPDCQSNKEDICP